MNFCFIGHQDNAGPREVGRQSLGDLAPNVKTIAFPVIVFCQSASLQEAMHTLSLWLKMPKREREGL